ncbi:MAG: hypothetical protein WBE75_03015 [Candidatus Omnitrophota bacterium]|jgi:hypothetical protein
MRDIVFKNLSSPLKRRKILAATEISDKEGIHSIVSRHFVYMAKEVTGGELENKPSPYLYILKIKDSREHVEKFFCRIKGGMFVVINGRLFLIHFMHSLKITLSSTPAVSA